MALFAQRNNRNNLSGDLQSQDDRLRNEIIDNFLTPAYIKDITDTIKWRYLYRKIGENLETISKIISAISIILAFSSGFFSNIPVLSYAAGVMGVISLTGLQISSYTINESKECNAELNKILSSITISKMPDMNLTSSDLPNILHNHNIHTNNDNFCNIRNSPDNSQQLPNTPMISNEYTNGFDNVIVNEVV